MLKKISYEVCLLSILYYVWPVFKKTATIVSHSQIQHMITPLCNVKTVPLAFSQLRVHFPMPNLQTRNETDNLRTLGLHKVSFSLIKKRLRAVC